ncbi:MAG: hypothetical protein JSU09_03845 [Bacteroidetes bacterium]|nr:hypothetical protein [Bacteroidota bacterium]
MKTSMNLKATFLFVLLGTSALYAQNQSKPLTWVVETNRYNRTYSIIHIYEDTTNTLLKDITLQGYLNIRKKSHKRKIEKMVADVQRELDQVNPLTRK